ncbi:MAG: ATP synthase subunit I [Deltaproteobacteria bacterium]|nr:ATP synthase subunit I [Deltaproteobacteria bacterium]
MENSLKTITQIQKSMGVLLLIVLVISSYFKPEFKWVLSVFIGGLLINLNFWVLQKALHFFLLQSQAQKLKMYLFLFLKLLLFMIILGAGAVYFKENIIGFVLGLSVLFMALIYEFLKGVFVHGAP